MKKIITLMFIIGYSISILAQNEVDAFRFSQFYYSGTARSMSMANSFGALGADISTASTNPAGMGVFKHSQIVFTPSLIMSNATGSFNGSEVYNDKFSAMINNLGLVFSSYNEDNDLRAFSFSFGYNRTNNFDHNVNISGVNDKGSMLDYFMLDANGNTPEQLNNFTTFRAWDTWLLDTVSGAPTSYTNPLWWTQTGDNTPQYGETQTKYIQTNGGSGEFYGNIAFNFKDVLFGGITVGMQNLSYSSHSVYNESNFVDNSDLNNFTFEEYLTDNGSGINIKAGLIVMPIKFVRIGAAIHSPTYFTINDKYHTGVSSHWNSLDANGYKDYESTTETNLYKYHILSPMRAYGDVGFIIGNMGLIGFEYEYVDYSKMRLSANDYMFIDENNTIRNNFKSTYNLKAGAELNLKIVRLRAGYALFGNPYASSVNVFDKSQISAGFGLNFKYIYFDFAYVYDNSNYTDYFYNGYTDEPIPSVNLVDGIMSFTLGVRY